jgi:N-acetylmuramoyl-L-alanine amidase
MEKNGLPTIVIDPGHGPDPKENEINRGSVGTYEKDAGGGAESVEFPFLREHCVVWDIAAGIMDRTKGDWYITRPSIWNSPSIKDRVRMINKQKADLTVSIHCDAFEDPSARGATTFFYMDENGKKSRQGEQLAKTVHAWLVNVTGAVDRGIKGRHDLGILRKTACPAILVEVGFLTNLEEAAALSMGEYRSSIGYAIFKGILEYVKAEGLIKPRQVVGVKKPGLVKGLFGINPKTKH